jgi:predicted transcriptional regulator YdeE
MNIVHQESFTVWGREARTSNAREMAGLGVISQLWSTVGPDSGPLVAVYSEYESDKDGEYTFTLGSKADGEHRAGADCVSRTVEPDDYLCLKADGTVTPQMVVALWQQVWSLEKEGSLVRAYRTDFETYTTGGMELYVGVKR